MILNRSVRWGLMLYYVHRLYLYMYNTHHMTAPSRVCLTTDKCTNLQVHIKSTDNGYPSTLLL